MPTRRTVLVTGATGALGLAAVEALARAGHDVIGTVRADGPKTGARPLIERGATAVTVNLFDRDQVHRVVRDVDAIVHLATRIPQGPSARWHRAWATNDRLRTDGTALLIEAARAAGLQRLVFASIALAYPDCGGDWISESQPLAPCSAVMKTAVEAERMLHTYGQTGGDAVCLRFGRLYGPGRASTDLIAALRSRTMPIVGRGSNFVSSVHVTDAGRAVAHALDAPRPRRLPYGIGKVLLGHLADVLAISQRVSNRRLRESTGWCPVCPSALDGWVEMTRTPHDGHEATAA